MRIEVFQVNIAERNIDFILAGEDESVRERIKMQLAEQRKSVSYRSDVSDQKKARRKKGSKDKFAKRGKGGIGGNKYLKDSKNKHGKRKKKRRNK